MKFLDVTLIGLLIAGLVAWWQSRALQKGQFKFEKGKLFHEQKKQLYSDFLLFNRGVKGMIEGQIDKEFGKELDKEPDKKKEIAGEQLLEVTKRQISQMDKEQISEVNEFAKNFITNVRIYGDVDLIAAVNRYMRKTFLLMKSKIEDIDNEIIIREGERLARAFRKNMGHDDSKLRAGSIMALDVLEFKPDSYNTEYQLDIASQQDEIFDACKGEKYEWLNKD